MTVARDDPTWIRLRCRVRFRSPFDESLIDKCTRGRVSKWVSCSLFFTLHMGKQYNGERNHRCSRARRQNSATVRRATTFAMMTAATMVRSSGAAVRFVTPTRKAPTRKPTPTLSGATRVTSFSMTVPNRARSPTTTTRASSSEDETRSSTDDTLSALDALLPKEEEAKPAEEPAAKKEPAGRKPNQISPEMRKKLLGESVGLGGLPDKPMQSNIFLNVILGVLAIVVVAYVGGIRP